MICEISPLTFKLNSYIYEICVLCNKNVKLPCAVHYAMNRGMDVKLSTFLKLTSDEGEC